MYPPSYGPLGYCPARYGKAGDPEPKLVKVRRRGDRVIWSDDPDFEPISGSKLHPQYSANAPITDPKLLARIRKMIRAEHAGFVENGGHLNEPRLTPEQVDRLKRLFAWCDEQDRKRGKEPAGEWSYTPPPEETTRKRNLCVEPGCSCWDSWESDGDPVSGPFCDPPVRCSSFEENVLPLDPDLEEAYWRHLDQGQALTVPRCAWRDSTGRKCRREVSTPRSRYCEGHALLARRKAQREYKARRVRESKNTPPAA